MTIKKALITKHFNHIKAKYGESYPYDYHLQLTQKQFERFREDGFNAKTQKNYLGEDMYFIPVSPMGGYGMPFPEESEFLNRSDVDISFKIFHKNIKGKDYFKLYFEKASITVKGEKK